MNSSTPSNPLYNPYRVQFIALRRRGVDLDRFVQSGLTQMEGHLHQRIETVAQVLNERNDHTQGLTQDLISDVESFSHTQELETHVEQLRGTVKKLKDVIDELFKELQNNEKSMQIEQEKKRLLQNHLQQLSIAMQQTCFVNQEIKTLYLIGEQLSHYISHQAKK